MATGDDIRMHSNNKNPALGNAVPVLGVKLKRGSAYSGIFLT